MAKFDMSKKSKNVEDLRKLKQDQVMRAPNAYYTQHLVDEAKRMSRQLAPGSSGRRKLQGVADAVMSPNHRVMLHKSKLRRGYR
jgi:hypothetical protein